MMEMNHRFLMNKHGDIYFLVHNFGALIILLRKEIFAGRKKDMAENLHKIVYRLIMQAMTLKTTRGTF